MGFIIKGVKSVVKAVVGVVSKVVGGVFGFIVGKKADAGAEPVNNLNKSLEPEAFRKIVLGNVASALDVRFWQVWGNDGSKFDEVLALAGHKINAVKELYLENDLAINAAGTVQSKFSGILSRAVKLGANNQTALSVGDGTQWGATATFAHAAHMVLKWVPDEKKLPNGIPSRYTQVVEGALVYDPRRDSTVPGGSGTHRINDRNTWQYSPLDGNGVPIGRNNALQTLWYLLGWVVDTKDANGNITGQELICGRGVDPEDINLASFIAGANACETAAYYTDVVLSTDATHTENESKITCSGLIGRLIDPGGLWSYYANVDDTANIAVELTDDDLIEGGKVDWNEYESMQNQYNQVTGKFVNPSATVLFQAFPYPMVTDATYIANLGIKRRKTQDFEQVLDNTLAQRLARLFLNEGQYQGEFGGQFNYRALNAQAWSVVRYTSERFGFVKLFRVWRHEISTQQGVGMTLKEIHPSIWQAGTVANALPTGTGQGGDAAAQIVLTGLIVNDLVIQGPGGNPTLLSAMRVIWNAPSNRVAATEIRYRVVGTTYWETLAPVPKDTNNFKVIAPLLPGAVYEVQARHISTTGVEGSWVALSPNFQANSAGNLTYQGIVDASGSAIWTNVTGTGKPTDNADVTAVNISSGFAGQKALATEDFADWATRVTGTGKPVDNAGTTLRKPYIVGQDPITEFSIIGNEWKRVTGVGWDAILLSYEKYAGACSLSFKPTGWTGTAFQPGMVGLIDADMPAPAAGFSYVELDYAFYVTADLIRIYESGTLIGNYKSGSNGDEQLLITYDGTKVSYYIDGALVRAVNTTANRAFRVALTPNGVTSGASDILFQQGSINPKFGVTVQRNTGIVVNDADVITVDGISSGFLGQKALATRDNITLSFVTDKGDLAGLNSLAFNSTYITNRTADYLAETASRRWAAETGANITETRVASGIAGQGSGATAPDYAVLNNFSANGVSKITNPDGAKFYGPTSSQVGALRIDLPVLWSNSFMRFQVDIFDYRSGGSGTYFIQGYNWNGAEFWVNTDARYVGDERYSKTVRFGSRNGKACVWIGNPDTSWTYPIVAVRDFQTNHAVSTFHVGWSISLDTVAAANDNGTGSLVTVLKPVANEAVFGESIKEVSGGAFATKGAYKTADGIASGFAGQKALATKDNVDFFADTLRLPYIFTDAHSNANSQNVRIKASYLNYVADGQAVENLKPQEIGSNKTETRISSGFAGQKALATEDFADWNSRITNRPAATTDLEIVSGTPRLKSAYVYDITNASLIQHRWPQEAGANITESRVASAIAGQGSGATASDIDVLNNQQGASETQLARVGGGLFYQRAPNVTGILKIKLPNGPISTMLSFEVDIYNYTVIGGPLKYIVGGYSYGTNNWLNCNARYIGDEQFSLPVRFGYDSDNKACIWIGETNTVWQYPQVTLSNLRFSYSNYAKSLWDDGWEISVTQVAPPEVDIIIAKPRPGDLIFGEAGLKEASNGVTASLSNFKTGLGISSGFSGQAPVATDAQAHNKISKLNTTGRFKDASAFFTAAQVGVRNTNDVFITATDAGTSASLSIPSHTRTVPGESAVISKTYNAGSITGLAFSTRYFVYCDDPNFEGGTKTYVATTSAATVAALAGRVLVGIVTTPADGGTSTGGGGTGEPDPAPPGGHPY